MAARFYRCGRMTSGRLGHALTLGHIQIGLNIIHSPMDQNKMTQHRCQKKGLCSKMTIAAGSEMIWT
jgi:hypothetical protein